ncbi:hypothetical protein V6N12_005575 [Hibiscus sabdariffa]|uniref:Hexosyltransferase n=1 Tax=Hibiscus sabdariffa TaxID=183260 RepID=A0ABR2A2W5_9ROSI
MESFVGFIDDDVHLLDADDVEAVRTVTIEGNGLNVEDGVWAATVARLGLENDQPIWGFVRTKPIVEDVWKNVVHRMMLVDEPHVWGYVESEPIYPTYKPSAHMYEVDYDAKRDLEHEARVFASSSASNYREMKLRTLFETKKRCPVDS